MLSVKLLTASLIPLLAWKFTRELTKVTTVSFPIAAISLFGKEFNEDSRNMLLVLDSLGLFGFFRDKKNFYSMLEAYCYLVDDLEVSFSMISSLPPSFDEGILPGSLSKNFASNGWCLSIGDCSSETIG